MLLTFAFFRWDPAQLLQRLPGYGTLQLTVRKKMSSIIKKDSLQAHYGLGICNGLLPCGLVYLAIVGAANMSTPIMGGGFMLAFGLGTLPLLVATLYAGRRLLNVKPNLLTSWSPLIMALMGVLLVWRGWVAHVPLDFYRYQDVFFPPMCH
jgi:sulfite exporter TauE/SafE